MARVTGLGGVFFKAEDPEAMKAWYRDHLGIEPDPGGYVSFLWRPMDEPDRVARTAWSPFDADTGYFAPSEKPWMLNYRVDDLDALLDQLREAGVEVVGDVEEYEYGRFGWIVDPEGNKVELWEPPEEPADGFGDEPGG